MNDVYTFNPGALAAILFVSKNNEPDVSCVFLSFENGVVVGPWEKPLAQYDWPIEVKAEINKHFGTVFSLPHPSKDGGVSPRSRYVDASMPWTIEVESESA